MYFNKTWSVGKWNSGSIKWKLFFVKQIGYQQKALISIDMKGPEGPPGTSSQTASTALWSGEGLIETLVTHEAVS